MSRKGENIYKRKDGRWEGRYIKFYDENRKAKYGYVYGKSYKEVKDKLAYAVVKEKEGDSNKKRKENKQYREWLSEWLKYTQIRVKESTYIRYKNIINNHIEPYLGRYYIQELTSELLQEFVNNLLLRGRKDNVGGLSYKTVQDIVNIIKNTFQYIRSKDIVINCKIERIVNKNKSSEMRVLNKDEEQKLLKNLMHEIDRYKMGVIICLYTGIRIGELCALQWKDVSVDDRIIKIEKTLQRLQKSNDSSKSKTHIIVTEPKSYNAVRTIPITSFLVNLLVQFQGDPNEFILTGKRNKATEPRTMQNYFKRYIRESGLEDANFHSLRHTFATRCVEVGFDIKVLSEILGHSSVKITLDKYVHTSIEQKRKNMDKLIINY